MQAIQNIMRREASRVASDTANVCMATVTSYDPNTYSAKVIIQPEGYETGFIPVATPWSGNGWGLFCPPTAGDTVEVHFQEGGKLAPYIALRFYGNVSQPLNVPSGEFWLVDALGNSFKFSGGKVLVNGHTEIDVTTPTLNITCSASVNVTTPNMNLTGNLNVTGNIVASGDISDLSNGSGTLNHVRTVFDSHTHNDPQGGVSATPNQTL